MNPKWISGISWMNVAYWRLDHILWWGTSTLWSLGLKYGGHDAEWTLWVLYQELFDKSFLVGILPIPLSSTWWNGWYGMDSIAKRLNDFLVHKKLAEWLGYMKSQVFPSLLSNHSLIFYSGNENVFGRKSLSNLISLGLRIRISFMWWDRLGFLHLCSNGWG